MSLNSSELPSILDLQDFSFVGGLITGGFVFFTLLAITVVWFLRNPLLVLLMVFTALQTILVGYDLQNESFGQFSFIKLLLIGVFTVLLQYYYLEIKRRLSLSLSYFERNHLLISVLLIIISLVGYFKNDLLSKSLFGTQLLLCFVFGIKLSNLMKAGRRFYRLSSLFLWIYSWLVFSMIIFPFSQFQIELTFKFSVSVYIGWLVVSFIAALTLIHQVVNLNTENFNLEIELLNLKNRLGFVQLESSENERKRIVSEIHDDVLNRIDMLSMTANQSNTDSQNINKNLSDSLHVLRRYTYRLYPPHIDILPLSDIFLREAEIWNETDLFVEVKFNPEWEKLSEEYRMPVFRFIESITTDVVQKHSAHSCIWDFNTTHNIFQLKLTFLGSFKGFNSGQEKYLIFQDLIDAKIDTVEGSDVLEIKLSFEK